MRKKDKAELEGALRRHYQGERAHGHDAGRKEEVAALAATSSALAPQPSDLPGFVRAMARSMPRALWCAPAAVVALAAVISHFGVPAHEAEVALAASGPTMAAASLAGVVRAKYCRMQELEASCLHNSAAVALSRLAAFGAVSLLALAAACVACSRIVPAGIAAACALVPYLIAAAGGLMLARKASSNDAALAAAAWPAGVCVFCVALRLVAPEAYCTAALWAWTAVATAGILWLGREAVLWVRLSAEGGCEAATPAPSPIF